MEEIWSGEFGVLTLSGERSTRFCNCGNQQWDQTRGSSFVLFLLSHLQTHLFVMLLVCLLYCPRIQNLSHHGCLSLKLAARQKNHKS